jgi:hypothetical protein
VVSYRAVERPGSGPGRRDREIAVTAEPSASIWEVTRLILESPELSPSDIAQEHGYSAAEVAELMPIFLDTARTDWSRLADDANGWAATGLDAGSQDAELYLSHLAGSGSIEVATFETPAPVTDDTGTEDTGTEDTGTEDTGTQDMAADGDDLPPDLGELLDELDDDVPDDRDDPDELDRVDASTDVDGLDGSTVFVAPAAAATGPTPEPDAAGSPVETTAEPTVDPDLDDDFDVGDDDPFAGDPYADASSDRTGFDTADERADVETDDVGDPFAG